MVQTGFTYNGYDCFGVKTELTLVRGLVERRNGLSFGVQIRRGIKDQSRLSSYCPLRGPLL